jgi:hypothetical protein
MTGGRELSIPPGFVVLCGVLFLIASGASWIAGSRGSGLSCDESHVSDLTRAVDGALRTDTESSNTPALMGEMIENASADL